MIADEARYVASAQIQSCPGTSLQGAIAEGPIPAGFTGSVYILPYQSNFGVRALIAAGGSDLALAKEWLTWYIGHANWPDYNGLYGSVYDDVANLSSCTLSPVPEGSTGHPHYDSTDSYAATWLSAMTAYAVADPSDRAWIESPSTEYWLDQEAHVAVATLQSNGLTWAKPDYHGQYLMDNAEVFEGLKDYVWLAQNVLGQPAKASYWQGYVNTVAQGIQASLFAAVQQTTGSTPMYGWASDQLSPSWGSCYPSAVSQLWTDWTQIGPAARQSATWAAYKAAYPGWTSTTPAYPNISCPQHDPESSAGYAAAMAGDKASANAWLQGSQVNWVNAGRPYPWTVADSGFRALTAQRVASE